MATGPGHLTPAPAGWDPGMMENAFLKADGMATAAISIMTMRGTGNVRTTAIITAITSAARIGATGAIKISFQ